MSAARFLLDLERSRSAACAGDAGVMLLSSISILSESSPAMSECSYCPALSRFTGSVLNSSVLVMGDNIERLGSPRGREFVWFLRKSAVHS